MVAARTSAPCDEAHPRGAGTTERIRQYQNLETGWWYIEADSGVMYTPLPLPDEFKVAGLRVQASLLLLKDTASFFPGTYVRIVSIEKLAGAAGGN